MLCHPPPQEFDRLFETIGVRTRAIESEGNIDGGKTVLWRGLRSMRQLRLASFTR
jgi:hypothetical protein